MKEQTATRATHCVFLTVVAVAYFSVFLLGAVSFGLLYVRDFYVPSLKVPLKQGRSALEKNCKPSTDKLEDLLVDKSTIQANGILGTHGAAVVQNVLTIETAKQFRVYVLKENKKLSAEEQVFVLKSEHRYNLIPDLTLPFVQDVLKQIASHPVLRPLIDQELGPEASLTSFSVLTAEYGAKSQHIHADATTSVMTHPNHFVKEYSLVIALQDTTKEMGATQLCPGTQHCKSVALLDPNDDKEDADDAELCKVRATLNQTDAFLYSSDIYHRGMAHTDPDAPERAFLFLLFEESRRTSNDKRMLPFGQVRIMDWRMWGHTIGECSNVAAWRWWHSFGLWNQTTRTSRRVPWNLVDTFWLVFQRGKGCFLMLSNDFDQERFGQVVGLILLVNCALLICLAYFIPVLLFGWLYSILRAADASHHPATPLNGKEKVL